MRKRRFSFSVREGTLFCFLEMLIIFDIVPVSAPGKAMLYEKLVAKVVFVDLVRKACRTVRIGCGRGRQDIFFALFRVCDIWIVQRIDINCQSQGMPGQARAAFYRPVIETGSIVVFHGGIIITVIFINQPDSFQLILIQVKFVKYFHKILRNGYIADQFAFRWISLKIVVQNVYIAEFLKGNFRFGFRLIRSGKGYTGDIAA